MKTSESIILSSILFSVLASVFGAQAFAYDDNQCDKWREKRENHRDLPFSLGTSSTKYGTSTTQFTTSTGACAALGMRERRVEFMAENSEPLSLDIAQGRGEYLDALARLSGCKDVASLTQFRVVLQKNFAALYYYAGNPAEVEQIAEGIDRLLQVTPELSGACQNAG